MFWPHCTKLWQHLKKRYQMWHIDGWTLKIITKVTVLNFSKEVSCKNIVIITYFHNNDYAILIGWDQISFFLKPSWNVNNKAFGNMVFKFPIMGYKIRPIFGHNQFIKWKLLDLEIGIVLSRQKLGIIYKIKCFKNWS